MQCTNRNNKKPFYLLLPLFAYIAQCISKHTQAKHKIRHELRILSMSMISFFENLYLCNGNNKIITLFSVLVRFLIVSDFFFTSHLSFFRYLSLLVRYIVTARLFFFLLAHIFGSSSERRD